MKVEEIATLLAEHAYARTYEKVFQHLMGMEKVKEGTAVTLNFRLEIGGNVVRSEDGYEPAEDDEEEKKIVS